MNISILFKIVTDMQFEMNVGTDYSTVRFTGDIISFRPCVNKSFINSFNRIGGVLKDNGEFQFPIFITSQVLEEVIRNTCFVCGGLMKDHEYHTDHILRKCSSCGHSHT